MTIAHDRDPVRAALARAVATASALLDEIEDASYAVDTEMSRKRRDPTLARRIAELRRPELEAGLAWVREYWSSSGDKGMLRHWGMAAHTPGVSTEHFGRIIGHVEALCERWRPHSAAFRDLLIRVGEVKGQDGDESGEDGEVAA